MEPNFEVNFANDCSPSILSETKSWRFLSAEPNPLFFIKLRK